MLRFIQFLNENLLVENRLDFIKQKNPTINSDHDDLAQHRDAGAIIDHFATHADPTPNKSYTQWIVNRYKEGDFRQEDHPRIREALSNFNRYRPKLDKKDVNQYKSLSGIEDAVEPHLGKAASGKEEKRQQKIEGADLIHEGPNLTVHHLKTKEAACQYGRGTIWCTAATNRNMFDEYNKEGPLYVVQDKHTGEKRQFHFQTGQFMDEKDRRIDLPDYIEKNPELKDVKQFRDSGYGFYFAKTPEEAEKKLVAGSPQARKSVAQNPNAQPHHLDLLMKDPDVNVRASVGRNPNAQPHHLDHLMRDEKYHVRAIVAENPSAQPYHLDHLMKDNETIVRASVGRNPSAQPHHLDQLMRDEKSHVRSFVAENPSAQPYHLDHLMKDDMDHVRSGVAKNPSAQPHHLDHLMKDPDVNVRMAVAETPSAQSHHLEHLMRDESIFVRGRIARNPSAQPHHLDHLMKHGNASVRRAVTDRLNAQQ